MIKLLVLVVFLTGCTQNPDVNCIGTGCKYEQKCIKGQIYFKDQSMSYWKKSKITDKCYAEEDLNVK
jgi:hypothetical protein